jgi:choice-of-anchor B domain-containing protein
MFSSKQLLAALLFAVPVVAYDRNSNERRYCEEECQKAEFHTLMAKTMALKVAEREECYDAGRCPMVLESQGAIPCVDGKAGVYSCNNIDLLSFVSISDMGGKSEGNDIWGWTDSTTSKEYALVGLTDGTSIVDVTNATNPIPLVWIPSTNNRNSIWRDLKVYKDHVYIGSEASNHGMQVFDLARVRGLTSRTTMQPDLTYTQFGSSHNIVINEESGFVYAVGTRTCSGGLHIVDVNEPKDPRFVGCFSTDGYTHDAQCVMYDGPDTRYTGREICFNYNEDTLTIVDVHDKDDIKMLSRLTYNGVAYSHQGWLTDDHAYILHNDELDEVEGMNDGHTETYIWDVSKLDAPVNTGSYYASVKSIDHNLYIKGNLAYESNYESGLRILDTTDIATAKLSEVAFFDVRPESTSINFNGAWSVYPYFSSGNLIVNSIERGLFVLKHNQ